MNLYEISAYRTDGENEKIRTSEEMNELIDLATKETDRGKSTDWQHYAEVNQADLIGVGFWLENLTQTNQLENEYLKNEVKEVIQFLKNKRSFKNYRPRKKKMKNDIVDVDIRFDQRLDAEQMINDTELTLIFRDYLKDEYLRDGIIKGVQGILNLIYDYRCKREKKRDRIQELKDGLKEEYRLKNLELSEKDTADPYDLGYEFIPPEEIELKDGVLR